MDFFNKIGSKLSEAGQGVSTQTKTLAEIAKINLAISNNEKAMNDLYTSLGKEYFKLTTETKEGACLEVANKIEVLIEENNGLRNNLNVIKGIVNCEKCNAEMSTAATCCNNCGAVLPKIEPIETLVYCSECGTGVEKGKKFCTQCGNGME